MRLLVPIDGSAPAERALSYALWLTQGRPDAIILLVNVQNRESLGLSDLHSETERDHELAEAVSDAILRDAIKACEAARVPFETRDAFGPISDAIVVVANAAHVDQIVMGTRGLGGIVGLILGSVATGVVHQAQCPVTLVKSTYRPRIRDTSYDNSENNPTKTTS